MTLANEITLWLRAAAIRIMDDDHHQVEALYRHVRFAADRLADVGLEGVAADKLTIRVQSAARCVRWDRNAHLWRVYDNLTGEDIFGSRAVAEHIVRRLAEAKEPDELTPWRYADGSQLTRAQLRAWCRA